MVEFLVSRGADVNRGDNEGWTPLHATASCGFLSIARHLMERGADVAAVNNDGELPLDIAESDDMEFLLFSNVTAQGMSSIYTTPRYIYPNSVMLEHLGQVVD
jgi:protein phosphatase 1 regulatory subunit 12A